MKMKLLFFLFAFAGIADAQTWSSVSTGLDGGVSALEVYNGELYVGGNFTIAGGGNAKYIARWNGATWNGLPYAMDPNSYITALAVYNGELYVGGNFTKIGGTTFNYIAKWNGTQWFDVFGGVNGIVKAFAVYNGELFVAAAKNISGNTYSITKWNGTTWSPLKQGCFFSNPPPSVNSLTVDTINAILYLGGQFTGNMCNTPPLKNAQYIAEWNGASFDTLGSGMGLVAQQTSVYALSVYNGVLYAAGNFTKAGKNSCLNIAKWNSSTWSSVGIGVNNNVNAFCVFNGGLYVGGAFTNQGNYIARWNGATWAPLGIGTNGSVSALKAYKNELYVGGSFSTAGGVGASYIAKWSSSTTGVENIFSGFDAEIISPNPNSGTFTILTKANEYFCNIINIFGEKIYSSGLNNNSSIVNLDVPNGVYFIQIKTTEGNTTKKIIIQR